MGIFSKHESQPDPLKGRAESLVGGVSAVATTMFGELTQGYPEFLGADQNEWIFLVNAAGLYMASLQLHEQVPGERFAELYEIVEVKLPYRAAKAMENCGNFVNRATGAATDPQTFEEAVGSWVLTNLFPDKPRADDNRLAALIGQTLNKTFGTWWD